MRMKHYPYLMATLAVAIFPAGARADTALIRSSQVNPANTAEPKRACGRPDVPAQLTHGVPIEISPFDKMRGGHFGSASVAVTLGPDGRLLQAEVLRSSGNPWLDEDAMQAILASTFSPEQRSCGNVGGIYQVEADFPTNGE